MTAFEAIENRKDYLILRLKLRPLTLAHLEALSDFGSPYVSGGKVTLGDLVVAVFVCAHEDGDEAVRDCRKWWFIPFVRVWSWLCRKADMTKCAEQFQEYLEQELANPPYKRPLTGGGPTPSSPWSFVLTAAAMRTLGMTEAQARATDLLRLKCLLAAAMELRGECKLWSQREEALWQLSQKSSN